MAIHLEGSNVWGGNTRGVNIRGVNRGIDMKGVHRGSDIRGINRGSDIKVLIGEIQRGGGG